MAKHSKNEFANGKKTQTLIVNYYDWTKARLTKFHNIKFIA